MQPISIVLACRPRPKKGSPPEHIERNRAILAWHKLGWSLGDIAALTDLSTARIRQIIRKTQRLDGSPAPAGGSV